MSDPTKPSEPNVSDHLPSDDGARDSGSGIAAAAAIIFFGSLASRILGLVREQLAAREFGAGNDIAAFTVADNLNTLLYDLLASGLTQSALVPVLAVMVVAVAATRSELRKSTGALLGLGLLVSGVLTALGIVFAPKLVGLMTNLAGDGSARGAATTELAIESLRIVLPSLVFLTAATILTASLYALEKPIGPALGFTARNAAIVISILLLGDRLGVRSMAVGVVVGAVLLTLVQLLALRRQHALPEISLDFRNPAVGRVFRLYLPVFLGLLVSSGVVILDRNLAWGAEQDAVGAMRFATALVQLVLGLVAAAVSLAALPGLSRAHSRNDEVGFAAQLSNALMIVSLLIIPAVLGMAALSVPIVDLLFEQGSTGPEAGHLIVIALLIYLPGHLLAAYDQVLIFAFYARQNTILPVTIGIIASSSYFLAAPVLASRYEMAGLVAANSIQLAIHTVAMLVLGRRTFGSRPFAGLPAVVIRILTMATVATGTAYLLYHILARHGLDSDTLIGELGLVLVPGFVAATLYATFIASSSLLRNQFALGSLASRFKGHSAGKT